jgi:hypothetical protein
MDLLKNEIGKIRRGKRNYQGQKRKNIFNKRVEASVNSPLFKLR